MCIQLKYTTDASLNRIQIWIMEEEVEEEEEEEEKNKYVIQKSIGKDQAIDLYV